MGLRDTLQSDNIFSKSWYRRCSPIARSTLPKLLVAIQFLHRRPSGICLAEASCGFLDRREALEALRPNIS